jgi:hypothetical protein
VISALAEVAKIREATATALWVRDIRTMEFPMVVGRSMA